MTLLETECCFPGINRFDYLLKLIEDIKFYSVLALICFMLFLSISLLALSGVTRKGRSPWRRN